MNIAILDAQACNPGDLSWEPLKAFGEISVYQRSSREELASRVADADVLVINKVICDRELLDGAPQCKMIAVTATGYNVVDLEECAKRGIVVSNVPVYSTSDVAQYTFAALLELTMNVGRHSADVMAGGWVASRDFCYTLTPLVELAGKTLGIVGMGSIGQSVARIARAFGMEVLFTNRSAKPECEGEGIRQVSLDDLLSCSDVVSLHVPATAETAGLINAQTLAQMKEGAFLINTARGGLVVEQDVVDALKNGRLAGFAADVVSAEPMREDCPFLSCKDCNIVVTPHIAWATREARIRCMNVTFANIEAFAKGVPQNVVS